ncbi:MAG TPA: DUF1330 domain-containing protein [Acidobacteriaceae bacterium]|nr:DUF1330 domain-containing protein [Acidobacteriaceae bacterium]
MPAYVVITREKTRNAAHLENYKKLAPAAFEQHPAIVRAIHCRHETLEGPTAEEIVILEFPSYEEAKAWYGSEAYQAASQHRFQGGDYRFIVTEGLPAK